MASVIFKSSPTSYQIGKDILLEFTTTAPTQRYHWISLLQHGSNAQKAWTYVGPAGLKGTAYFPASTLPKNIDTKFFFKYNGSPITGQSDLFEFSVQPATPPSSFYLSTGYDLQSLHKEFNEADPDLSDDGTSGFTFKSAICTKGNWIMYAHKNYNDDSTSHKAQIVQEGQTMPLTFQPKSVRPMPLIPNSVTLFEHPNYGGTMKTLTESTDYLPEFPVIYDSHGHRNKCGVSSIHICDSKAWRFFTGPDYSGLPFVLDPKFKRHYENPSHFSGLDEAIQSVQRVD